ncbi:MAG: histidine--tRNA ligase [Candidatus Woesearchaeota archaeon]
MNVQGLKGTRDFYPENMRTLNYIFSKWKSAALKFGYQEIDGPLLEPIELWTLKSGNEIPEQMYRFKDKGDREVAIRPELTPTIARMVAQKQRELPKPIKWFSIPRCWRYEAPQSGRLREFFQFNLDCLGTTSMLTDAEVIATAVEIMKSFGCGKKDFFVRLNNRKLLTSLFLSTGIKQKQLQEVCRLIDKKCKLRKGDFELAMKEMKATDKQIEMIKDILEYDSLKDVDASKLDENGKKGYEEVKELMKCLEDLNVAEFIKLDFSIMRGFDYYTSTVFEVFDASHELRAIAGGGRYEDLVKDFGGEPCPGVGYGMGDVVLEMFLRKLGKMPELKRDVDYYVAPINKDVLGKAMEIANILREKYSVEVDLMEKNLRKQFEYADSIGAKKIVIVGPKDLEEKKVTVREMASGKEEKISLDKIKKL